MNGPPSYQDVRNPTQNAPTLNPYFLALPDSYSQHYAYAQSVSQPCMPTPGAYSLPYYYNCMPTVQVPPADTSCTINSVPTAQPEPTPTETTIRKGKGLVIKDPATNQTVDITAPINNVQKDVQQGNKPLGTKPLVFKDPPARATKDRHEPTHEEHLVRESVERSPVPEEELKVTPPESPIQEDPKEPDAELPADESESSASVKEEDKEEDDEEVEEGEVSTAQDSDEEPNDSSTNSDVSDVAEKTRRYDRNELIALRTGSEATAPNFLTSSAVSINHAERSSTCYRREKQRRCITLKTNIKLDDVENAYKPAHLREPDSSAENRTAKVSKDLNIILNRLLDDNISDIVLEIRKLSISGREEVSALVDVLTAKATRQAKYSEVFARLCSELSRVKPLDPFKILLVTAVNKMFETPLETYLSELNTKIDAKIAETTDEKVKKMLEEDRETAISKKRDAYLGIIQFFSHLFVHKIITDKSAAESLKSFAKPTNQDEVLALLTCLNTCGCQLENRIPATLKECISGLETAKKQVKMEQHVAYKIEALIELKNRQWKKQEPIRQPSQTIPRSDSRRDIRQRPPSTLPRRSNDIQMPVNVNALTVGGPKTARYDSLSGPRIDWSKGSSAASNNPNRQGKNRFHGIDVFNSEINSESESGKESRAPSSSTKRRVPLSKNQAVKVDEKMSADDAITEACDAFRGSDSPSYDLPLREPEKAKFVSKILQKNIDRKDNDRKMATDILSHVYKKKQLTTEQISVGFSELLDACDEDFVMDCPKADTYIAEFLTALLNESSKDVNIIVAILSELPDDRKCEILATCLSLASKQLGEGTISTLFSHSQVPWPDFSPTRFGSIAFLQNAKCSAGTEARTQESKGDVPLKKIEDVIKNRDFEDLRTIFEELASSSNTEDLWQVVKSTMDSLKNAGRQDIEQFVQILQIVADRSDDFETTLLLTLQDVFPANETFRQFLQSLLQYKVISNDGLNSCFTKSRPEYKEIVKKIHRKGR